MLSTGRLGLLILFFVIGAHAITKRDRDHDHLGASVSKKNLMKEYMHEQDIENMLTKPENLIKVQAQLKEMGIHLEHSEKTGSVLHIPVPPHMVEPIKKLFSGHDESPISLHGENVERFFQIVTQNKHQQEQQQQEHVNEKDGDNIHGVDLYDGRYRHMLAGGSADARVALERGQSVNIFRKLHEYCKPAWDAMGMSVGLSVGSLGPSPTFGISLGINCPISKCTTCIFKSIWAVTKHLLGFSRPLGFDQYKERRCDSEVYGWCQAIVNKWLCDFSYLEGTAKYSDGYDIGTSACTQLPLGDGAKRSCLRFENYILPIRPEMMRALRCNRVQKGLGRFSRWLYQYLANNFLIRSLRFPDLLVSKAEVSAIFQCPLAAYRPAAVTAVCNEYLPLIGIKSLETCSDDQFKCLAKNMKVLGALASDDKFDWTDPNELKYIRLDVDTVRPKIIDLEDDPDDEADQLLIELQDKSSSSSSEDELDEDEVFLKSDSYADDSDNEDIDQESRPEQKLEIDTANEDAKIELSEDPIAVTSVLPDSKDDTDSPREIKLPQVQVDNNKREKPVSVAIDRKKGDIDDPPVVDDELLIQTNNKVNSMVKGEDDEAEVDCKAELKNVGNLYDANEIQWWIQPQCTTTGSDLNLCKTTLMICTSHVKSQIVNQLNKEYDQKHLKPLRVKPICQEWSKSNPSLARHCALWHQMNSKKYGEIMLTAGCEATDDNIDVTPDEWDQLEVKPDDHTPYFSRDMAKRTIKLQCTTGDAAQDQAIIDNAMYACFLERASLSLNTLDECPTSSFMPTLPAIPRLALPRVDRVDGDGLQAEREAQADAEDDIESHKLDWFKPVTGAIALELLRGFEAVNGKENLMYRLNDGSLKVTTPGRTIKIDTDTFLAVKSRPGVKDDAVDADFDDPNVVCTLYLSRVMKGDDPCAYPFPAEKCKATKAQLKEYLAASFWTNYRHALAIKITDFSKFPTFGDLPKYHCHQMLDLDDALVLRDREDVKICQSCISILKRYFSVKLDIPDDTIVDDVISAKILETGVSMFNWLFATREPGERAKPPRSKKTKDSFKQDHWLYLDTRLNKKADKLSRYKYPGSDTLIPGPTQVDLVGADFHARRKAFCTVVLPKCTGVAF